MAGKIKKASSGGPKKHTCPDCHFCQQCSESRCQVCRSGKSREPRLTIIEQITRFEELNKKDRTRPDRPIKLG